MSQAKRFDQKKVVDAHKLASQAIAKIAPSWPLDKMIAVNPYWHLRQHHRTELAAYMGALAGVHMYMREADYLALYLQGRVSHEALELACREERVQVSVNDLVSELQQARREPECWSSISDLLDQSRAENQMSWQEEVVHQISQFCAAHYQNLRPLLQQHHHEFGTHLYRHWLENIRQDKGIEILMSEPGLNAVFKRLPEDELELIQTAVQELGISEGRVEAYLHGLLLSINGWASYVSYLRWQKDLGQGELDDGVSIVAIRLAWELALYRHTGKAHKDAFVFLKKAWQRELSMFSARVSYHHHHQQLLRVWARALELSEQIALQGKLASGTGHEKSPDADNLEAPVPVLQAVFCIDVRSEVMRRALESQDDRIETYGFAGFFGLPISFQPDHTAPGRPQLPGLLAPQIVVKQKCRHGDSAPGHTLGNIQKEARWQRWGQSAGSGFSLVETSGWMYGWKLLKQTLFPHAEENPLSQLGHHGEWQLERDGQVLSVAKQAELCKGILSVMGIQNFAETVLLVGHGSHTANNLQAAGLDCGACGGQTGEVNVRVLAYLLNDQSVRAQLADIGVSIPESTRFVPALHNTTTDALSCFSNRLDSRVVSWLEQAKSAAQKERARLIDPAWLELSDHKRDAKFQRLSQDWSQVRPEWGLANNKAFIIAPRARTRGLDLEGRVFLHDYDERRDPDLGVLELLMTAPMIVTNWINMQYNASVTDNHKYGSGNKVLHNAVGGNLGVFEGNGGDLRIGLSKQSVHNGEQWMHTPQSLCVYIAASQSAINTIMQKHEMLRDLVDNQWLHLFQWQEDGTFSRYVKGSWEWIDDGVKLTKGSRR